MAENAAAAAARIPEEDLLRAQFYGLIAQLLLAPPPPDLLARIGALEGDDSEIGQSLGQLAQTARQVSPGAAAEEYQELFIGVARGELVPYGSYYLTGFLNEKPLARLRQDMARHGIVRAERVAEPEDHIGTLCEIMAGLITGEFGAPADLVAQRQFFHAHVASWAGRFFGDLETAQAARLYAPLGRLGRVFMDVEAVGFDMAA